MMNNVLVFGGAGFLGQALVRALVDKNINVCVVDIKKVEEVNASPVAGIRYIQGNIHESANIYETIKQDCFDVCYYLAWDGLSGEELTNYHTQLKNVESMLDCMEMVAKLKCKKFIGAGSISQLDEVYKNKESSWEFEKHCFYKHAQNMCCAIGSELARQLKIEFYWPIITNIYGVGEISQRLINTMIRKLLKGERMDVSSGEQMYDFVYIEDAANMYVAIGRAGKENHQYLIGSGSPRPLKEYFRIINTIVNPGVEIKLGSAPFSGTHLPKDAFNIDQLIADTGYVPQFSFKDGIIKTMKWIETTQR